MQKAILSILIVFLLSISATFAQDVTPTPPEPQRVELAADDGLIMVGDFYTVPDLEGELPTVLLMHQSDNSRIAWRSFIPILLENGYNALAVDLRGFGETKGERSLEKSKDDTQAWLNWLRDQPSVKDDKLAIIGASVSSGLALTACAADAQCVTAISLSPLDAPTGVHEAMSTSIEGHSALLIASQRDSTTRAAATAKILVGEASGEVALYLVPGTIHGMGFVNPHSQSHAFFVDLILNWLNTHMTQAEGEK